MAININAKTTGVGGLETSADNSGEINIQSGGSTVMNVTSSGVAVTGSFSQNGAVYSTQPTFRNLIINGDMKIAQRGTSASGITTGYHTTDRFFTVLTNTGTWTESQDTDAPTGQGFSNSIKLNCTTANASLSADSRLYIASKLEAQNLQHLNYGTVNAKTITLSFWVKTNKTGTYIFEIYQSDSARSISKAYTVSSANTWEKKTITIEGDTSGQIDNDNNTGIECFWWLVAGTNYSSGTLQTSWGALTSVNRVVGNVNLADSTSNYINITGVQLEVGSTATEFEHLPYDVELARCQRYYYKTGGTIRYYKNSSNTSAEAYPLGFPVYMRVSPSMSFGTVATGGNTVAYSIAGASNQSVSVQITANGASGYARLDAQLIADSEL